MLVTPVCAKPATTPASQARLQWGYPPTELGWYYTVGGDFDQNGEINASDVTALGQHFGEVADRGFFIEGTIQALIDADRNGEINLGDLVAIGANFGADALGGFDVYRDGALAGHVDFSSGAATSHGARLFFTFELGDDAWDEAYIVPVDNAGASGIASTKLGDQGPPVAINRHFDGEPLSYYYKLSPLTANGPELLWYYDNHGDYDQNGYVKPQYHEIKLIEFEYGATSPWSYGSIQSVYDGDKNGEINLADLTMQGHRIGFNRMAAGFFLYLSTEVSDIPTISDWSIYESEEWWDIQITELTVPSLVEPIAYIPFIEFQGDPHFERIWFTYTVPDPDPDAWYWVRPVVHGKVGAFTQAIQGSAFID